MTLRVSRRSLALALIQVLLVAGIGAKLLADRERFPRVWVEAAAFDPSLPIRGRYVSLAIAVVPTAIRPEDEQRGFAARLRVDGGRLLAVPAAAGSVYVRARRAKDGTVSWVLQEPVLYFLPEHAADPTRRPAGEVLWAEVTVPDSGPPRPIRLGLRSDRPVRPLPD
jgi:hypothetical protein